MKRTKRIFAIFMTLALAMSMLIVSSAVSFAATSTITVPDTDSHKYDVYQIFTGDISNGSLINVKWGKNGTGTEGEAVNQTVLTALENAAAETTDSAKLTEINKYVNLNEAAEYTVDKDHPLTVPTGYYLIKDKSGETLANGDEHTLYIVKVVGPTNVSRKASTTEAHKKLDDANDSNPSDAASNGEMQTSSDYDIGDEVPYHLTATLTEKIGQYKKYHIDFVDTLQSGKFDGITLNATDIKINGVAVAETEDYTVSVSGVEGATKDGFTVTLEFTPKEGKTLDSLAGAKVTIDFTATLGVNANIGSAGNTNTFHLEYSNNPNDAQGGEEGQTPEETVITFTYKVVINKVDQNNNPLEGATFELYKVPSTYTLPTTGDAAAKGADAASHKIQNYTAAVSGDKSDVFTFKGLDDGRYVLVEKTVPAGYNPAEPQVFDVAATHGGNQNTGITLDTLTGTKVSGEITLTRDTTDEDALKAEIKNQKGATLPETGGIGTIIFYVLGSLLVVGCGIVLISKRRMESR